MRRLSKLSAGLLVAACFLAALPAQAALDRKPTSPGEARGPGGPTGLRLAAARGSVVPCDQMGMVANATYNAANGNAIGGAGVLTRIEDLQVADDCALDQPLEITEICQASLTFGGQVPANGLWLQVYADNGGSPAESASFTTVIPTVSVTPFTDNLFFLAGVVLCGAPAPGFVIPAGTWWLNAQPVSIDPTGDWYYQVRLVASSPNGGDSYLRDAASEHGTSFGGPYPGAYGVNTWTSAFALGFGRGDAAFRIAGEPAGTSADLTITKTDGASSARPGDVLTYTIVVGNAGPDAALDSEVVDLFPAGLESVSWTCSATVGSTCTAAGTGDLADSADLAAGGTATYVARGTVRAGALGPLDNSASVAPGPSVQDPQSANNAATDTTTILAPPVLEVPTLDTLGLVALAVLLAGVALLVLKRAG